MKKSKSSGTCDRLSDLPCDRLSDLPESLIFQIFWLLPMRDVVRTTILSKHWKNLWTTAPCLNFEHYYDAYEDKDKVRNFVNRALLLWGGMAIQKFKIDLFEQFDDEFFDDYDFWMHFVMEKKVQELYFHRNHIDSEEYRLPKYLYSCSSLKVLSLVGCNLRIDGNVEWSRLKSLKIDGHGFLKSENVINQILSGSPRLEDFFLTISDSPHNLSIRSTTLKRLSIHKYIYEEGLSMNTELRIWTPNLETLEISGVPYRKCSLMDVCSLTHATLDFFGPEIYGEEFYENDFLGETLSQIFPTIQHVERLTLSDWCIQVLGDWKNKYLLSSSSNVKFLKLIKRYANYEEIVGVLEIFPKLKMLSLEDETQHLLDSLKIDVSLSKSFLLQLRTVKITWAESNNSMFPFIKIVLKYASNLEKMVIRVQGIMPPAAPPSNSLFLASQKLLRMPRSSTTAELVFCEY